MFTEKSVGFKSKHNLFGFQSGRLVNYLSQSTENTDRIDDSLIISDKLGSKIDKDRTQSKCFFIFFPYFVKKIITRVTLLAFLLPISKVAIGQKPGFHRKSKAFNPMKKNNL
jgi:hypothetical protein